MVTEERPGGQIAFTDRLRVSAASRFSWLCIGLDPDLPRLPHGITRNGPGVVSFCREIIAATVPCAAAYKINLAFFEAMGLPGWRALEQVRASVPPEIPVIADAKRGDIGNSSRSYASALFDMLDFDAATVSPYLGFDALEPFLQRLGKGVFVLCKTSNPGASALQDQIVGNEPLYRLVARMALAARSAADVGLVVGATHPDALRTVRALSQDVILLVPGVGAQGASAETAVSLAANRVGQNAVISASREILYASTGVDFAARAGDVASRLARETWIEPAASSL